MNSQHTQAQIQIAVLSFLPYRGRITISLPRCHISYSIMHVWLALFSIVVKFNSLKSLQSHCWEWKTSAKWSLLALRTMAEPGFTWCVPQRECLRLGTRTRVCVCVRACGVCVFLCIWQCRNPGLPPLCCPMSCLWRAMTIKQLFTSKATEKKWERCENANEARYAPKLLRRDSLLGQRHTGAHTVRRIRWHAHNTTHMCSS